MTKDLKRREIDIISGGFSLNGAWNATQEYFKDKFGEKIMGDKHEMTFWEVTVTGSQILVGGLSLFYVGVKSYLQFRYGRTDAKQKTQ